MYVSVTAVVPLRAGRDHVRVTDLVARSEVDSVAVRVPVDASLYTFLLGHHTQHHAAVAVGIHQLLPETR